MQTAQKVITAYRHKRIIVCLLVALATLGATLAIRFISQRSVNEDYIRTAASQRVAALNDILRPLSAQRATLLPLVGKPCPDIHLTLRKMRGLVANHSFRRPRHVRYRLLFQYFWPATGRLTSPAARASCAPPSAALLERQLLAQRLAGTDPMVSSRGERPGRRDAGGEY